MLLILPFVFSPIFLGEKIGGRVLFFALGAWGRVFSLLNFIAFKSINRHLIDPKKAYIYTCNHGSYLDVVALVIQLPGQFRPLGKIELTKIPVFGWIVKAACVLVDRSSPESRKRSILDLKNKLEQHISIFIFPEGKMNRTEKPLTDFYDGAFRIAIDTQTPILPMVILNAKNLMPRGKGYKIRPGKIVTIFGQPIQTTGLTSDDVESLKKEVHNIMANMIVANTKIYYPVMR